MRPQMIPDTHLLKLLFLARYTHRSIRILHISTNIVLPTYFLDVPFYNILHINAIFAAHLLPFLSIKTQKSLYNRQIFAQIKRAKNIDSFEKK